MRQSLFEWCSKAEDDTLLRQWDTEKNADLTPYTVSYGSQKKPYWRCDRGHSWQATVFSRTAGAGCPYCAGKRVWRDGNDLASAFPEVAAEWHPMKNAPLTPGDVRPGTHRRVWWKCKAAGHEWYAEVKSRAQGCGCPVCANRIVLPGFNDLATTHPALALEWNAEKNNGLTPADVVSGTDRRVWWRCRKNPKHEWRAAISSRVGGMGCPICAGKRVRAGENDLASQYPKIAAEWDFEHNNGQTPDQFMPNSNRKVRWICPLGHTYDATICSRTTRSRGCPYCAGRKVLLGFNDLATKDPKLAAQWYQPLNGSLTPEMVTCGSAKKVFWRCAENHVWPAIISSRAGKQRCGCPICAGKTKVNFAARYQEIAEQARASFRTPRTYAAEQQRGAG